MSKGGGYAHNGENYELIDPILCVSVKNIFGQGNAQLEFLQTLFLQE